MSTLSINLLPGEFRIDQKAQKKFQLVQRISIGVLMLLIFLASISFGLKIFQSQDFSKIQARAKEQQTKVESFKSREATLVVLKNRLSTINKVVKSGSNNIEVYQRIFTFIPPGVVISSLSVDRSGNTALSVVIPSVNDLEQIVSNMTSNEASKTISKIEFESLSRDRDGVYRTNLKIVNK